MYTQITCPRCQTNYPVEVHQVIDVGQNPRLKQLVMSGRLNVAVCPNCGAAGQLSSPIVYHDPEHELFMAYVPPEANMNQMEREQMLGNLTRQVVDALPPEKRKGYLFQPQMIINMQTFYEKVLETEGITKEMIDRQQKQSELLQTMINADRDTVTQLIEERGDEIDETFFAMLQSYLDAAGQAQDDSQMVKLTNLRARLMTDTPLGRQLEKQQIALHRFNQDAKKQEGVTPALLLKHILANLEDESVIENLIIAARPALTYEFFSLLTLEIEKQETAGNEEKAARLTELRQHLLNVQQELQKQSEQLVQNAAEMLQMLRQAEDKKAAIQQHMDKIDDAFMYVLSTAVAQADNQGNDAEVRELNELYQLIMSEVENQYPPEVLFLNSLLEAESEEMQREIIESNRGLLTEDLIKMLDALEEQVAEAGQDELNEKLRKAKAMIMMRM